jgi:hypothetical protein
LANHFNSFELVYVPREQNARADLLSKLASTKKPGSNRTFIQETIANPSITEEPVMMIIESEDWRAPIIRYLQKDELPAAREEAYKVKKMSVWYSMLGDKLYKRGFFGPFMLCVSQEEAKGILEEIHEGSCGSHIGARALAGKVCADIGMQPGMCGHVTNVRDLQTHTEILFSGRTDVLHDVWEDCVFDQMSQTTG